MQKYMIYYYKFDGDIVVDYDIDGYASKDVLEFEVKEYLKLNEHYPNKVIYCKKPNSFEMKTVKIHDIIKFTVEVQE